MKQLKARQSMQLPSFHFLFFFLNPARDSIAFISEEINSKMLGQKAVSRRCFVNSY